uniref:Protein lifeguard 2 n=1 Tax=Cyprinus carpio TaxID=7962 RepID=A0A8C1X780_CYPCA
LICLQVLVTSKSNNDSDVQPMAPVPPSYEEATTGESPCYSGAYTGDGEMLTEFSWDDQNIRRIFIRKVYTILMIQLSITIAFVALFVFCEPVKYYIQTNPGWRQFPWNLILLIIFTLSLSYMTGMLSSYYNTKSVIICLGITALVCLAITIFSFQTKIDITSYQGVLLVFCTVLFICGLVLAFTLPFGYVPWLQALYAVLGAMLFCMFLAFDTQMLMGKKQYTISPEEYIFATLSIYLDIVYIFSFILQLFGTPERE